MTKIVYSFFYLISLLPWRVLFLLSDFEYLFVYKIFGYRTKVVRRNLSTAFPDKGEKELRAIERRFYHWFCDYFFEAVKLLSISEDELRHHFRITNSAELEECFQQGQSVGAILGHYCNWEWLSCVGYDLPGNRRVGLVYSPLHNKAFDHLFQRIRSSQASSVLVPKKDILRFLIGFRRDHVMSIFGYISDQGPKWSNIHLWVPFLNHDTPVFTGAERIMRKMNNAVYYVDMSRPRRGYYEMTYRLITKEPQTLPEFEVTRRFFQMLEETIRREPAYYLWTHNRWKRTHEEFDRRFVVVNGKVIPREEHKDAENNAEIHDK